MTTMDKRGNIKYIAGDTFNLYLNMSTLKEEKQNIPR